MNKNYNLKLDLQFRCNNSTMKFNQFDNNTSDFFMKISNGGKSFNIEKAIVVLAVIKPSGKVASQFVEVKNDIIYADLKSNMKDETGTYTAKAMLILEDERVVTDPISYEVEEDKIFSLLNDTVETAEDFTLLTDMLSRLSTIEVAEEQRVVNEAERILAEENRKIEEAKRVEAELVRQHEEADRTKYDATRESNENIRKQNESIRLANETNRIDEEAKRVEEENKRKLAEEERNANYDFMTEDEESRRLEANAHKEAEVLRVQAETDRVNEEAKRRTTEQARVSAENTRVSNENTREANEVARQSNETQRVEAETQRQNRYDSFIVDAEANANNFENYTNNAKVKEEERKSNELDRKSQEARRVSNEVERISNENTRKANEKQRQEEHSRKMNEVNEVVSDIQKDYDSLQKIIIDENASANLQNQINLVNSQLEHKANDNIVVKKGYATLSDFDEETRAAIQGLEPGTINAVLGEKNVKYNNTDFVDLVIDDSPFEPIDLYNKSSISGTGYWANTANGQIINNTNTQSYVNTGFIECNSALRYLTNNMSSVCFYDNDKNFISSIVSISSSTQMTTINNKRGNLISIPNECKYFIFNIIASNTEVANIWQMDRYQDPETNDLTIPRLDLNKKIIKNINGVEPINNKITLKATDIGALEQKKVEISNSLPYALSDTFEECNGEIEINTFTSEDVINITSANKFDCEGVLADAKLCSYSFIDNIITIESSNAIASWSRSYVSFDVTNLSPNTDYRLKFEVEAIEGYADGAAIQGAVVYDKDSMSVLATAYTFTTNSQNVTFNSGNTANIQLRLYPVTTNSQGNYLKCEFKNVQITKADKEIEFSKFYNKSISIKEATTIQIPLLPAMEITSENSVYDNSISIKKLMNVGQVNTINGIKPNEQGDVELPKSIISGKVGVFFGDSITEFGTYPQQVGDITGLIAYNVGVGGCRMSNHTLPYYDKFSMTKLADAITTGVWTDQENAIQESIEHGDDNTEIFQRMKSIDFNNVDYIIIAFGTNDFGGGITIGDANSDKNNTTFCGAIKYVIETILTTYPKIKLFFLTPIFRWKVPNPTEALYNSDITPIGELYLKDYANAIIKMCEAYHVPVLDLYNKSNINAINHEYYISTDGTHPTREGYTLIAEKVSKFLLSN